MWSKCAGLLHVTEKKCYSRVSGGLSTVRFSNISGANHTADSFDEIDSSETRAEALLPAPREDEIKSTPLGHKTKGTKNHDRGGDTCISRLDGRMMLPVRISILQTLTQSWGRGRKVSSFNGMLTQKLSSALLLHNCQQTRSSDERIPLYNENWPNSCSD